MVIQVTKFKIQLMGIISDSDEINISDEINEILM